MRYVEIKSDELLSTLNVIGMKIQSRGGSFNSFKLGKEIVYDFTPPHAVVKFRVYTSVAQGEATARGRGKDAVRITLGTFTEQNNFKPLTKSQKVLRTAPKNDSEGARVEAFLERLTSILRTNYKKAATYPKCPRCGHPMATKENKKTKHTFLGCVRFPTCNHTQPAPQNSPKK